MTSYDYSARVKALGTIAREHMQAEILDADWPGRTGPPKQLKRRADRRSPPIPLTLPIPSSIWNQHLQGAAV